MTHRFLHISGPRGEWVYSKHQGTAAIVSNAPGGPFEFTYNTRPTSSVYDVAVTLGSAPAYTETYQIRTVDFSYARYLVVTDPVRVTMDYEITPRGIIEVYGTTGGSAEIDPSLRIRTVTPPEPEASSTPDEVIAGLIANLTSPNQIIASAVIEEEGRQSPIYVDELGLAPPWNRAMLLFNFDHPTFGDIVLSGVRGLASQIPALAERVIGETLVSTDFVDITNPGLYLLTGSLEAGKYANLATTFQEVIPLERGDPENIIREVDSRMVITIGPVP